MAPVLKVAYNGVKIGLQGPKIRGPYWGTKGSIWEFGMKRLGRDESRTMERWVGRLRESS